jgi:hypothetical protein
MATTCEPVIAAPAPISCRARLMPRCVASPLRLLRSGVPMLLAQADEVIE